MPDSRLSSSSFPALVKVDESVVSAAGKTERVATAVLQFRAAELSMKATLLQRVVFPYCMNLPGDGVPYLSSLHH